MPAELHASTTPESSSEGRQNIQGLNDRNGPSVARPKSTPANLRSGVPQGSYLSPKTSGIEQGSSYIARSGYSLLATSEQFVQSIEGEIDGLLTQFERLWQEQLEQYPSRDSDTSRDCAVDRPSIFSLFKRIYKDRGWPYFQLYWSEHLKTRKSIYDNLIRCLTGKSAPLRITSPPSYICLTDRLRLLLPLVDSDESNNVTIRTEAVRQAKPNLLLRACGISFMLRLLQSTTALLPKDVDLKVTSARIPIEAGKLFILVAL